MCKKCSSSKESNACGCSNASGNGTVRTVTLDNILDNAKTLGDKALDVVSETTNYITDEVADSYGDLKKEGQRFDKKQRLIKSVPNSVLVFGAVGVLIYAIMK